MDYYGIRKLLHFDIVLMSLDDTVALHFPDIVPQESNGTVMFRIALSEDSIIGGAGDAAARARIRC